MHLLFNDQGELLWLLLTPGNVDDRKALLEMLEHFQCKMFGKIFADRGYILQPLFEKLLREKGIALILMVTLGSLLPLFSSALPVLLLSALLFGSAFLSTVTAVTTLVRRFLEPAAWTSALAWFTVAFALGQCFGPALGLLWTA